MAAKIILAELAQKVEKLQRRLKKDEREGLIDGKERVKREPSEYNRFIGEEIKKMKKGNNKEKFAEAVRRWKEKQEGKDKRKERKRDEEEEKKSQTLVD